MKLNQSSFWAGLLIILCPINEIMAVEYILKPGQVISIKSSTGKTTYHFDSSGVKQSFLRSNDRRKQNLQKRLYKCDRLMLAHQDAGLHKNHPDQYFEIEKLLEISRSHQQTKSGEKAESSILAVEKIFISIESRYPEQNFSSIRNCFNLARWEQCI